MTTVRCAIVVTVLALGMTGTVRTASAGGKDEAAEFDRLLERHHQDISTAEGKAYEKTFMNQYERTYGAVLGDCIERTGTPATLDLILVIGKEGRVTSALAKPRSRLSDCVILAARKDAFPKPPNAPFHIDIVQRFGP